MNSVRNDKDTIPINTTEFYITEGTSTRNKKIYLEAGRWLGE